MHAPINQFTCQAIYLPTVSTLFHSMPCKATSILCCSCHLISFYLVVSRLVLSHTSFHLIYIFPLSALVYCMTLHFIIWRKMFTYVEYIYNMPLQRSFSWKSSHCTRCHFSTEHSAWEQRDITWHPSSWQHKAMKGTWLWQWMRIDRIL
jgi:hypothetical protein